MLLYLIKNGLKKLCVALWWDFVWNDANDVDANTSMAEPTVYPFVGNLWNCPWNTVVCIYAIKFSV